MHATSAGDRAEARSLGPNDVSMGVARWDFESLYAATYPDMVRLAYLLTGSLAQAEEVTQDSFVRLYEQWAEVANHPAYLRASVVNGCRSWHRSRFAAIRRESRLARPDGHHHRPDEIIDALAKLPRRRREIIVLRFYQGLALADIASVLGISEGTVNRPCITASTNSEEPSMNDLEEQVTHRLSSAARALDVTPPPSSCVSAAAAGVAWPHAPSPALRLRSLHPGVLDQRRPREPSHPTRRPAERPVDSCSETTTVIARSSSGRPPHGRARRRTNHHRQQR